MRILITNNTLAGRAGTELYVRDLALRLLASGHAPIAYSRRVGEVADELRQASVPVLDDLDGLGEPPDVIHGQHHLEVMTAVLRFPAVPAVVVCHGWLPPEEAPPSFPTIRRYVAVDRPTHDRLVSECGIPPARVVVVPNFVDLERFQARQPLPARPRRALLFSNQASERTHLPAVRAACEGAGLELDVIGLAHGTPSARPEEVLGGYDVVFAKGRAALEAAAVGAAVIVCDAVGLGPMVTAAELSHLRALNFGLRLLRRPVTPEAVAGELARYDPRDAAAVSRRLREEADLVSAVDRLVALYGEVVEEHQASPSPDLGEIGRAAARYLRHGPLRGFDPWQAERDRLVADLGSARQAVVTERVAGEDLRREIGRLRAAEGAAPSRDLERAREAARVAAEGLSRESAHARGAEEREDDLRRRLEDVATELRRVTDTATWRARERLFRHHWFASLYRKMRRLPAEPPPSDEPAGRA